MAEPLSKDDRAWFLNKDNWDTLVYEFEAWEATVRAAERRAEIAEKALEAIGKHQPYPGASASRIAWRALAEIRALVKRPAE